MKWWKEGKLLNKKNTFEDYLAVGEFLIKNKYTSKKKIIGFGGSAGGLLMGAVVNQKPEIFLAISTVVILFITPFMKGDNYIKISYLSLIIIFIAQFLILKDIFYSELIFNDFSTTPQL